jgi:hypothetical protein
VQFITWGHVTEFHASLASNGHTYVGFGVVMSECFASKISVMNMIIKGAIYYIIVM